MKNYFSSITDIVNEYRISQGWDTTDRPCILAKSLVIEAIELLQNYRNENPYNRDNIEEELADVFMYGLSLIYDLDIDLEVYIKARFEGENGIFKDKK